MTDNGVISVLQSHRHNGNQNRYTKKQEQRRKLDSLLLLSSSSSSLENKSILLQRRDPTEKEVYDLFKSLKDNRVADFGLVKLSTLNLNVACSYADRSDGVCQPETLLQHAIRMNRDKIAMALLRAGANIAGIPTTRHLIANYPIQYVVWLLKSQLQHSITIHEDTAIHCSVCGNSGISCMRFAQCGHMACSHCLWNNIEKLDTLNATFDGLLSSNNSDKHPWSTILDPIICCITCGHEIHTNPKEVGANVKLLLLSREECKSSSYGKWSKLPVTIQHATEKVNKCRTSGVKDRADGAMHLSEIALVGLGKTQSERHEEFRKAIAKGDIRRVAALIEAGVDLDAVDEYGMTALMLAVWLTQAVICKLLLDAGADSNICDSLGNSAWNIAAHSDCEDVVHVLNKYCPRIDAMNKENSVQHFMECQSLIDTENCVVTTLIPRLDENNKSSVEYWAKGLGVKGAEPGAFHVDSCFDPSFLHNLIEVHSRLTIAPSDKPHCASRSYFCDVDGHIVGLLEQAIRSAAGHAFQINCGMEVRVFPQMRFLHYTQDGSALAPHVDLSHRDIRDSSIKSTHTFILYLTDCSAGGGETVLLRTLCKKPTGYTDGNVGSDDSSHIIEAVSPKFGRLLIFPHFCPHEGHAIRSKEPKLLLRGEVYLSIQ